MSKRHRGRESSLDLLLDTICNTFGGILFIAILIVILLRMTSNTEADTDMTQVSEAEQLQLEQQRAELQGTLDTLRNAASVLDESDEVADSAAAELLDEFKDKQKERQQLLQQRLQTLDSIAEHQTSINQSAREDEQLEKRERGLKERKEDLEVSLKTEVAMRSQKVEYSEARASGKQEIQTDMRYGRFYVWHRYGPSGRRLGLNTDEYVVLRETSAAIFTTQMPYSGTKVEDTPNSVDQLTQRLGRFNPSRDYICVVVWPDSFEQFRVLKKLLVQLGFEYRLIPAKDGQQFRDRGGASEGVQ
jgi:hypothetical protein